MKRLFGWSLIITLLLTCLVGVGWAATQFNDTIGDHKWSTAGNWSAGKPDADDDVTVGSSVTSLIVDEAAYCKSFNATGTSGITITWSYGILTYGANTDGYIFKIDDNVTIPTSAAWGGLYCEGNTGKIHTLGKLLGRWGFFQLDGANVTLTSDLNVGGPGSDGSSIRVYGSSTLTTDDYVITAKGIEGDGSGTKALDLGSSVINIGYSGISFNASSIPTITSSAFITIDQGGSYGDNSNYFGSANWDNSTIEIKTYNGVTFTQNGTNNATKFCGNLIIDNPTSGTGTIKFINSTTTKVGAMSSLGTSGYVNLQSDLSGTAATLSDTSGLNSFRNFSIKDMAVGGGATWSANTSYGNTNVSGNSGWTWDGAVTPSASISAATNVAKTTLTGNGSSDSGGGTVTERGVLLKYGSVPTLASYDFKMTSDGTTGSFSGTEMNATGLTANRVYTARAFATNNEAGTGYSTTLSYTTLRDAGIFYMRHDGTSTSLKDATGHPEYENDVTKCLNETSVASVTLQDDDQLLLSDKGGTFGKIVITSSGSDGHPLIIKAVSGETPTISTARSITNTGWDGPLSEVNKVYHRNVTGVTNTMLFFEDSVAIQWTRADQVWTQGDGSTIVFSYTKKIWAEDGLAVDLTDGAGNWWPQTLNVDYLVTPSGAYPAVGGYITFLGTPPPSNRYVCISRNQVKCGGPGTWYYSGLGYDLYYFPSDGLAPSNHTITGWWMGDDTFIYGDGLDLRNLSNVEVSGLTFDLAGIIFGVKRTVSPTDVPVRNIKIYNNTINRAWWAIYGDAYNDIDVQDVEIYNNTLNYCSSGISAWIGTQETVGHTQKVKRINIHHNTINKHWSIDDTNVWTYAIALSNSWLDHEAMSFQDLQDCTISHNVITLDVNPALIDYSVPGYFCTGINVYLSANSSVESSGNVISHNTLNGPFATPMYISYTGAAFGNNKIYGNVIRSTYSITCGYGIFGMYHANTSSNMNYFCNNIIDYPIENVFRAAIFHGSTNGYWTFKNNIIKAHRIYDVESVSNKTYDYNNYYAYEAAPFDGNDFTTWKGIAGDANSYLQNPNLRSDSAITTSSPTEIQTGGTPIDGITYSGTTGLPDILGNRYDVDNPAMGAFGEIPYYCYVLLLTADPGAAGSFTDEADYTGYTRQLITFSAAGSRSITQSGAIAFPYATAGSNVITYWAIADALTGGNMLAYGAVSNGPVTVIPGKRPTLANGEVVIELSTGGISTAYGNAILDWMFRGQSHDPPSNIYVALTSTASTDTSLGTELSGSGYARALCNSWTEAVGGQISNAEAATFPQATAAWTAAVSLGLLDASTGGTYMMYGPTDLTVPKDGTAQYPIGEIEINFP